MKSHSLVWNLGIVVILAVGLAWAAASRISPAAQAVQGRAGWTPEMTLPALDGGTFKLSELRGKPVIVNFWATWCPPCRAEIPAFQALYDKYRGDGLVIVGVDLGESQEVVAPFASQMGMTYPIALDEPGEMAELYRISGLPTTFFINREGVIQDVVVGGPLARATIEAKVLELMQGGR